MPTQLLRLLAPFAFVNHFLLKHFTCEPVPESCHRHILKIQTDLSGSDQLGVNSFGKGLEDIFLYEKSPTFLV